MVSRLQHVCLLAILACETFVNAQERPTMDEYKAAKAKEAAAKDADAAREKKTGAVGKVVSMLENLQKQVLEEGEKEAATYDKFACFCRDMTNEKTKAIKKGKDEVDELSAEIAKLQGERDDLNDKIGSLNQAIEKREEEMAQKKTESDKALAEYEKTEADLSAAIAGVRQATKALSASGSSFVQLQSVSKTVSHALMLADALGLKSAKSAGQIFLQQPEAPEVEMEDYKFHSSGIIDTLEKLTADFEATKQKVDADEVQRVSEYNMAKQADTDYLKDKNLELEESKESRDQKSEDIAENSQELTTTSATLLDDQEYLSKLSKGCSEKAQTWDQRSKVRVQELTAITEATDIVKATVMEKTGAATIRFVQVPNNSPLRTADAVANNEGALMALEAEAESTEAGSAIGFLQRRLIQKHQADSPDADISKQMVVSMLSTKGHQLKSTLLIHLASQIGADPLAKVKKLIQELIERLLTEAANEADQKGWCDKALADAKDKRERSKGKAEELNAKMAKLEATRDKLTEELGVLASEIKELTEAQTKAGKMRGDEKEENKETVHEAEIGLEATQKAIQILSRFYGTAAKAKIDLSLTQADPFDDAPDAGFKTGEAYTAAGSDSGGITGMLQVIESDFQRTIDETKSAEAAAEKEYNEYMTESSKSLAEKNMATEQKSKYLDETNDKLGDTDGRLRTQTDILVTSIKELLKLQPACIDTGMSYADRVAMREQEIESLKKALCILGAYAKYGPDGLKDAC